jgi:hypothetical protein
LNLNRRSISGLEPELPVTLENQYNTLNSENWAHNISTLKINNNHKIITYDIKDLYINIPIQETLTITKQQLLQKQ